MTPNFLDEIVHAQKRSEARGIPSICSAHPWVLKAAIQETLKVSETFRVLLVESTCNQVNQFGGYTGMTPAAFATYLHGLAAKNAFPADRLILGGDHLGPGPWQNEPAKSAMQKAADLVRECVQAGYTKIHLDASMRLADDDPSRPLDVELSAHRTAFLAGIAEQTLACASLPWRPAQGTAPSWPTCACDTGAGGRDRAGTGAKDPESAQRLRYIIGSEVPIPGGVTERGEGVHVTKVKDARHTLEVTHAAFRQAGLESAWECVIAMVVQPGVEFGEDFVQDYHPALARRLSRLAETTPLVYEAHSTDYQTEEALRQLVRDHFAILKVGPALTFAFREAVFALAMVENELIPQAERSRLVETLDEAMQRRPEYWKNHYHGTPQQVALARKYSLSDRLRYYWGVPQVQAAFERLLQNLSGRPLPLSLISQFMPEQFEGLRRRRIANSAEALILDKVRAVLEMYNKACG